MLSIIWPVFLKITYNNDEKCYVFFHIYPTFSLLTTKKRLCGRHFFFVHHVKTEKKVPKKLKEETSKKENMALGSMQQYRDLRSRLENYGCDLSTMPTELGTEDEVQYAIAYLRQRVRSLAADALQRRDPDMHQHWLDILARPARSSSVSKIAANKNQSL
jgi:hypothetical protein